MRTTKKISGICLLISLLTACSTQQLVQKENITQAQSQKIQQCKDNTPSSQKIKKEAVAFSCIASLAFSRMIGQSNPKALICVAGGAAGFLFGNSVAERKCEYSVLNNQLEGELAHASKMKENFSPYLLNLENKLNKQSSQVAALTSLAEKGKADQSSVVFVQNKILKNLSKQRGMLKTLNQERMTKVETINMAQSRHRDIETIRKLQTEVRSLLKNIKKMQQNRLALSKLNNVTRDLFAQAKER